MEGWSSSESELCSCGADLGLLERSGGWRADSTLLEVPALPDCPWDWLGAAGDSSRCVLVRKPELTESSLSESSTVSFTGLGGGEAFLPLICLPLAIAGK